MKKEIILVVAVIALVAFSGCLGKKEEITSAFVGGTAGLTMKFQDLPVTVFPNTPFNVVVLVVNAGEYSVLANEATFVFNNAATFNVTQAKQPNSEALPASRKVGDASVEGGQQLIIWPNAAFSGTVLTEQQKVTMAVEACYPYKSMGVASVCIARTTKICNPVGEKSVQSSGAPVKFTSFKQTAQSVSADQVYLEIAAGIENKGDGKVYSTYSLCPSPVIDYLDSVHIIGIKLGDTALPLKCDENPIYLSENKGEINCGFYVNTTEDIQEQLSIELAYKYKQKISSEIAVIPKSGMRQ